jgi:hypothetical protein
MRISQPLTFLCAASAVAIGLASLASPCRAQDAPAGANPMSFAHTKQVLGLEGLPHNVMGTLAVENGSLIFAAGKKKVTVPAASITEVMTGKDTERSVGGTVGTLSMFAPYGGGRFLSLFRTKIDTLAITYTDSTGGVHGAIFAMVQGNSLGAKKALLLQGAKTSVPPEVEADAQAKPKEKK